MKWESCYDGKRRVKRKFAYFPVNCEYSKTTIWLESYFACQEYNGMSIYPSRRGWRTIFCTQDADMTKEFIGVNKYE